MRPRISVLLVEDDEDDFLLTQGLLAEHEGAECSLTWARTFEEGLRRLTEGLQDVCLLDYSLGERTGMELLVKAHAAGVEVPIIFLTGQTGRALDMEATRAGAADYLVKGRISADQLERSIRYAIERGRSLSALRQLNRELELTRNQAVQANRAKSEFLAALGGAYREPLAAILASSDALQQRVEDGEAQAQIEEIRGAGQRLWSLLSDVLGMTARAIEAPAPALCRVELGPFIDEIGAAIRPLVAHNHNTFQWTCPADIGGLETDPAHLGRVLLNLLGNVCKFTRRGCIDLTVSRHRGEPGVADEPMGIAGGEWVELAIRPRGLWMSPAQLELLFAGLPQAEPGDMPRDGAAEPGMASLRRVCRALGGALYIECEGPRRPLLRVCLPDRAAASPRAIPGAEPPR